MLPDVAVGVGVGVVSLSSLLLLLLLFSEVMPVYLLFEECGSLTKYFPFIIVLRTF